MEWCYWRSIWHDRAAELAGLGPCPSVPAAAKWVAFASLTLWIGSDPCGLEVAAFIPGITVPAHAQLARGICEPAAKIRLVVWRSRRSMHIPSSVDPLNGLLTLARDDAGHSLSGWSARGRDFRRPRNCRTLVHVELGRAWASRSWVDLHFSPRQRWDTSTIPRFASSWVCCCRCFGVAHLRARKSRTWGRTPETPRWPSSLA